MDGDGSATERVDLRVEVSSAGWTRVYQVRGARGSLEVFRIGSTGFPVRLGALVDGHLDVSRSPYELPAGEAAAIVREVTDQLSGW